MWSVDWRHRAAWRGRLAGSFAGLAFGVAAGCGTDSTEPNAPPFLAVLSAMPSELAPNLTHAEIAETVELADRQIRVGTLAGVPVVLGMTGIGMTNASTVTRAVLDRFPVQGVVVCGVANTSLLVGDVAVPETWVAPDGTAFAPSADWLEIVRELADSRDVALARCSTAPPATAGAPVCTDPVPRIVVGGVGRTSDPFGGAALPCVEGGGGVFGCDAQTAASRVSAHDDDEVEVVEMETAMIAREATTRGLPFIAFRGTSDDADGVASLVQFFSYYGLAADTASQATRAFLARLGDGSGRE